jgi:siroheme synthase (precorrin-2 oxidase/ferrochelatase)
MSALIAAGPAFAQQLREQVNGQLMEHSIEVQNFDSLTQTQLQQIMLILNTTEDDSSKAAMIESLVAQKAPCVGNEQLRAQVAAQLQEHGIQVMNFDAVSGNDLVLIEAVMNSTAKDTAKKAQIERIFAEDAPISANERLRESAAQCARSVNADVDLDAMTPDQLVRIELIGGGSESESQKRQMIEKIADQ